jgi:mono/diheme cytochrome c family protein
MRIDPAGSEPPRCAHRVGQDQAPFGTPLQGCTTIACSTCHGANNLRQLECPGQRGRDYTGSRPHRIQDVIIRCQHGREQVSHGDLIRATMTCGRPC